jgi:hypothetical protein
MGDRRGMIRRLPVGSGWTDGRDMPAPAGRTFHQLYKARARGTPATLYTSPVPAARGEGAIKVKESR